MHILIIHQAFASFDEPGGTRHYEFARLLAARGHRVTVIASPVSYITGTALTPGPSPIGRGESALEDSPLPPGEGQGVRVLRASVYTAHHKSFFHRVLAFFSFMVSSFVLGLGVKNVSVVWGTSPPIFQGVTAWMLARLKDAKFLFEVRDLWPKFAIAVGVLTNPILIWLTEGLERFLYRRADRIVVNSPGFVEHVTAVLSASRSKDGFSRITLIPNGADPAMFDPADDGADFRRAHGLGNKFVALYAGAHGMSNDLDVVLDAAKILRDVTVTSEVTVTSPREIQIVLLGGGKEKPALQARAEEMKLTNVTFVDSVPKSEVPSALAAANACIAILKPLEEYKTTYPNKVFDYMAAGRSIVLAIDGVIREAVEAAGCGLFAAPGDPSALAEAIRQLAADEGKSRKMGLAGRKYLEEHFSRDAIGEKLVKLLEDLVH